MLTYRPESSVGEVRVPRREDNLFARIIGNAATPNRPVRERQCAEMLCVGLRLSPCLLARFTEHLARISGLNDVGLADLRWEIDTEQSISGKRDDLRLVGWQRGIEGREDKREVVVVWSIEIKVGAGLHTSSRVAGDEGEAAGSTSEEEIPQIVNYDKWLCKQQGVQVLGGFVLALRDLSKELKEIKSKNGLKARWRCLTWTDVGAVVADAAGDLTLRQDERFLLRHMLGFIRRYLWKESGMDDQPLEFHDIGLARAFAELGPGLLNKVRSLAKRAAQCLDGHKWRRSQKIRSGDSYFSSSNWAYAYFFIWGDKEAGPWLGAGIFGATVGVRFVCPKDKRRELLRACVRDRLKELPELNDHWRIDEDASTDIICDCCAPLEEFLHFRKDQSEKIEDYITRRLRELEEVITIEALDKAWRTPT